MSRELLRIRRDVSYEQLIGFLKVMGVLPLIYRGMLNNGNISLKSYWNRGAHKLNAIKGGTLKSGVGWSQYLHYWRYRVKQRIIEIITGKERSNVPEDDYIPISELDRLITSCLDAHEIGQNAQFEFNPEAAKITDFSPINLEPLMPSGERKRRHSVADIAVVDPKKMSSPVSEAATSAQPIPVRRRLAYDKARKAIKNYYNNKPLKKNASAPTIRRLRSHSFTHMGDALEFDRKMRLEIEAEKTSTDPEAVKKREEERVKSKCLISQMLKATADDCLRILVLTNTVTEILNNNPMLQRTLSSIPIIY